MAHFRLSGVRRRFLPSGDKTTGSSISSKVFILYHYVKAQTEKTSCENRLVYAAIRRTVVGWWIWSGLPRKRIGAWSVLVANALSNGLVHGIRRVLNKNQTVVLIPRLTSYLVHWSAQFFFENGVWSVLHLSSSNCFSVYANRRKITLTVSCGWEDNH